MPGLSATQKATDRDPTVAAVVINFNGGQRVLNTLAALAKQDYPLQQIVVVDNGSTDGSIANIKEHFPDADLVELEGNQGLPAARNAGLAKLNAELVLMLDYDVYPEADCLRRLVEAYQEESVTLVCPRIRLLPERDIVQAEGAGVHFIGTMILRNGYQPLSALPTDRAQVDACIGACMMFNRRDVLRAGGFNDLYFFYFEDLEFGMRLRSMGCAIVCEPTAIVFHDRGDATPDLSFRGSGAYPERRACLTIRNHILTVLIHYRVRTLLLLSPVLLSYQLAVLAVALYRGWWRAWLQAMQSLFNNRERISQLRRTAQQQRKLNDRDILTGGPVPLTPGFVRSRRAQLAVDALSGVFNAYWWLVRNWVG